MDVTVADVQAALPNVTISSTSDPSTAQVEQMILDVQSELTALLAGVNAGWPEDGSVGADFIRATWIAGAKAAVYQSKYAGASAGMEPAGVKRAVDDYNTRLGRLPAIARGIIALATSPVSGGRNVPLVRSDRRVGVGAASFAQYTAVLNREEVLKAGWRWGRLGVVEPWWW